MTYNLVCKWFQLINSSNNHKNFALTATNKASSLHAFLNGTPEPAKVTHEGDHTKGSLLYTNAEFETLLQLMEKCLPGGV